MAVTSWESREFERYVAAKLAECGLVALSNPQDKETDIEIDIYALRFEPDTVRRAVVECKVPPPSVEQIKAANGIVEAYGAEIAAIATMRGFSQTHEQPLNTCEKLEMAAFAFGMPELRPGLGTILDERPDFVAPLGPDGTAVQSSLRCLSALRRKALNAQDHSELAKTVCRLYTKTGGAILEANPYERHDILAELHASMPKLSQDCAREEKLGSDPKGALYRAYAHGRGTYTQSALMTQLLQRVLALITIAECSLTTPGSLHTPNWNPTPRVTDILQWLQYQDFKHLLAPFVYRLVFIYGGFLPWDYRDALIADMAKALGTDEKTISKLTKLVNSLYKVNSGDSKFTFIKEDIGSYGFTFDSVSLCPFALKGVGVKYIQLRFDENIEDRHQYYADWAASLRILEAQCEQSGD